MTDCISEICLQKVNFFVRGQANSDSERCGGCNHLKSLAVRLSPQAVICEFRIFAGDSTLSTFIDNYNGNIYARKVKKIRKDISQHF